MKTILTLDKANQPFGFPQLNSGGTFDNVIATNITGTTISATTYLNLPEYTTTGLTGSSQTLTTSFNYYGISFSGNVDLILPTPIGYEGKTITIKDESGLSSSYRIRLSGSTGLIDNNSYVDMNTNYMSLTLLSRNNNWWII
jgi:hypothetical protein